MKRTGGLGMRVFLPMFGLLGFDYGFGFDKIVRKLLKANWVAMVSLVSSWDLSQTNRKIL
ncbi:MAG: hypothetical protein IPI77_19755 [Saprospiraceae bacterium]|nr:hypothetical protein [Saprospiraceae bacterium]